jgi:exosortase H (IPTLxxWG-CTERM-specific)
MPAAPTSSPSLFWSVVRFALLLPALSFTLGLLRADRFFTPLAATLSGAVIRLFSPEVTVQGSIIQGRGFGVNIYYGCDAEDVIMLFAAAVIAFPAPWRARLLGVAVGTVLIVVFNLFRIVSLFYIGVWAPSAFEMAHLVVWQVTGIVFATTLYVLWIERVAHAR